MSAESVQSAEWDENIARFAGRLLPPKAGPDVDGVALAGPTIPLNFPCARPRGREGGSGVAETYRRQFPGAMRRGILPPGVVRSNKVIET